MNTPNFFLVGAAKSGTTSLHHYLSKHPEVFLSPVKEPNYFNKDIQIEKLTPLYRKMMTKNREDFLSGKITSAHMAYFDRWEDYLKLFEGANDKKAVGDFSVSYLHSFTAAKEIYKALPQSKIIIILRNPMERAYSHFQMNAKTGISKPESFLKAIEEDLHKNEKGWGISHLYIELGLYYQQVKRYFEVFGSEKVKVFFFEDFRNDSNKILHEFFHFIDVDRNFSIDTREKLNEAQTLRFRNLHYYAKRSILKQIIPPGVKRSVKRLLRKKEDNAALSAHEKKVISKYFEDDILKLGQLLERDLSGWLK